MFTGVCLSTGGDVWSPRCLVPGVPGPGGGTWSRGDAWWRPPRTATAAGGTHPTGMHFCIMIVLNDMIWCQSEDKISFQSLFYIDLKFLKQNWFSVTFITFTHVLLTFFVWRHLLPKLLTILPLTPTESHPCTDQHEYWSDGRDERPEDHALISVNNQTNICTENMEFKKQVDCTLVALIENDIRNVTLTLKYLLEFSMVITVRNSSCHSVHRGACVAGGVAGA